MTFADILPAAHQLPARDKLRLIRALTEDLEAREEAVVLETNRQYEFLTPYDSYGAAAILMTALREAGEDNALYNSSHAS